MKLHIQNVHIRNRRASKPLPAFTPCAKPSKRSKINSEIKFSDIINSEGIMEDESILLVNDSLNSVVEATLQEAVPEFIVIEEDDSKKNPVIDVEMKNLVSCLQCDFSSEVHVELEEHIKSGIHISETFTNLHSKVCNFMFNKELY